MVHVGRRHVLAQMVDPLFLLRHGGRDHKFRIALEGAQERALDLAVGRLTPGSVPERRCGLHKDGVLCQFRIGRHQGFEFGRWQQKIISGSIRTEIDGESADRPDPEAVQSWDQRAGEMVLG